MPFQKWIYNIGQKVSTRFFNQQAFLFLGLKGHLHVRQRKQFEFYFNFEQRVVEFSGFFKSIKAILYSHRWQSQQCQYQ